MIRTQSNSSPSLYIIGLKGKFVPCFVQVLNDESIV